MEGFPEAGRRRFGYDLRRWRGRAGLTQAQLASAVFLRQSQISGIERGSKGTRVEQIRRMDEVLNAGGVLLKRWEDLHREDGYASWARDFVALEREASEIRTYQLSLVPGILQVEPYARALIQTGRPGDTPAEIDEAVNARIRRQAVLEQERGPVFKAVVEEHVLRRPIGGGETMRQQLGHMLDVAATPRVTIQVVPMNSEVHHGADGAFTLYTIPDRGQTVYMENRVSSDARDDLATVEEYAGVFGDLCSDALPPSASRALIERIKEEVVSDQ